MKEELQLKLVEILTSIQSAAGKASDFALSELPDIAQSYLTYGRVEVTAWLLLALFLVGYGIHICGRAGKEVSKPMAQQNDAIMIFGGISGIASVVVGFIVLMATISNFFLVWFAPKVWLLKELAHLLK